jgi:hypothetical protein
MVRAASILIIFFILLFAAESCKTKNDTVTGGGKGGNVTIRIIPEIYGSFVDTCVVFIKYGSLDAPGNGVYDDSAVCTVSNDTSAATFNGLTTGLYYFFARGYHTPGGHLPNVKGGINATIQKTGSYLFFLPTSPYSP